MNRMYLMMSRSGIFDHLHRFVGSDPPSIRFRRMEHLLRCFFNENFNSFNFLNKFRIIQTHGRARFGFVPLIT